MITYKTSMQLSAARLKRKYQNINQRTLHNYRSVPIVQSIGNKAHHSANSRLLNQNSTRKRTYTSTVVNHVEQQTSNITEVLEPPTKIRPTAYLRSWTDEFNVNHNAVQDLMLYLRQFPDFANLPKDTRTLMQTPKATAIINVPPGIYCHIGIKLNIDRIVQSLEIKPTELTIDFNIDGASMSGSTNSGFWLILGRVTNLNFAKLKEPFVVGIYHGYKKPASFNNLLAAFTREMKILMANYCYDNISINIKLRAIICDAPARAAVCGVKQHNGTAGCAKCCVYGTSLQRRMTFQNHDSLPRTDEMFRSRIDEKHHNRASVIEELNINMVKQIPLDYMHLVCLGIVKRLIQYWTAPITGFVSNSVSQTITEHIERISLLQPAEFQRKARSLTQIGNYKASEFRTMLLYIAPVLFKNILSAGKYQHFLLLHTSILILCSKRYMSKNLPVAEKMLKEFVGSFAQHYGASSVVYNVHSLLHLCDDARMYGTLDEFSAFVFENYICKIKKKLHHGNLPLQQVSNRIHEMISIPIIHSPSDEAHFQLKRRKVISINGNSTEIFHQIKFNEFKIDSDPRNSWFMTKSQQIVHFDRVQQVNGDNLVFGKEVKNKENFYCRPIQSSKFRIFEANKQESNKTGIKKWRIDDIDCKLFAIPYHDKYVFFPLLHC
jgi:hypothetical protein